jgi:hypothetical protein
MNAQAETPKAELTAYETEQVREIAAWKSQPPNPLAELWKRITLPAAKAIEKVIPDRAVRVVIERSYDISEIFAGQEEIKRQAGVKDLDELRDKPLEECDRLARQVGRAALALATAEGAVTGAGGVWTTLIDVPLLFILALSTIRKLGHCYGYPLAHRKGRHFVFGVLIAAASGSLETRRQRLHQLRELEDLLIQEAQEEALMEEVVSFLFQLEVFEEVPGIGAISGALLNLAFLHRVDVTARRVFQEHWLQDNSKVHVIEPAPAPARHLATGWSGALGRFTYAGFYYFGFGVALPACVVASLFRPMNNALTRGLRDGSEAATQRAEQTLNWARGTAAPTIASREAAPALAPT